MKKTTLATPERSVRFGRACFEFIAIAGFIFCSCNNPSDKVAEQFKETERSLEEANQTVNRALETTQARIDSQMIQIGLMFGPGEDSTKIANSRKAFAKAVYTINNLNSKLKEVDPDGEKLDVAEKLIINSTLGDSLFTSLVVIYKLGVEVESDPSTKLRYHSATKPDNKQDWLNQYFNSVPTIAAITMLNKFKLDVASIQTATAESFISKLRNSILTDTATD